MPSTEHLSAFGNEEARIVVIMRNKIKLYRNFEKLLRLHQRQLGIVSLKVPLHRND